MKVQRVVLAAGLVSLAIFAGEARAVIPADGGNTGVQPQGVGGAAGPYAGQANTEPGEPEMIPQEPSPENPLGLPGVIIPDEPSQDGAYAGQYPPGGGADGVPGDERGGVICIIVDGECTWIIKGTNEPAPAPAPAPEPAPAPSAPPEESTYEPPPPSWSCDHPWQDVEVRGNTRVYRWDPAMQAWRWIPDLDTAKRMCVDFSDDDGQGHGLRLVDAIDIEGWPYPSVNG